MRDEVMTLFLAGHETTAVALSWTFYLLAQHPEADARLGEELRTALGGRQPAVTDLPALRYTERVVTESMRLYPPAYGIGREAARPTEVAGRPMPAGDIVIISTWVVHRDGRWFRRARDVLKGHVSDQVYEQVRRTFTEKELTDLTLAIGDQRHRLNIAARTAAGSYQPAKSRAA